MALLEEMVFSADQLTQLYEKTISSSNAIHLFQEKIADRQQRLQRAKEIRDAQALKQSQLKTDPEYSMLIPLKERRDVAQRILHEYRDRLDEVFFLLRRILEKPSNLAFNNTSLRSIISVSVVMVPPGRT